MPKLAELIEFRFTLGNLVGIVTTVAVVTIAFNTTTNKVDALAVTVGELIGYETRIVSLENVVGVQSSRADNGRTASEKLETRVDKIEDEFSDIKVQLGRIEERLISLTRGTNGS